MIVLNSLTAVRDLMEKRSANYSCRPRFVLIAELYVLELFRPTHYGHADKISRRMGWDTVL